MAKKRKKSISSGRKGEGNIFKRGNTYYLQYTVNGKRKVVSLRTGKQVEALEKAKDYLRPVDAKTKAEVTVHIAEARKMQRAVRLRLEDVWDEYVKSKNRPDSGANTLANYAKQWTRFRYWVRDSHPELSSLGDITEEIALEYAGILEAEYKLAPATLNAHRNTLRLIAHTLRRKAGLDVNPWDAVTKKTLDTVSRRELSEDDVKAVLAKIDDPDYCLRRRAEWRIVFRLGAFAGLRLVDAVKLEWDAVNWGSRMLSLVPQKTARRQKRVTVPMHPEIHAVLLDAWRQRHEDAEGICPRLAAWYDRNPHGVKKRAVQILGDTGFETSRTAPGRARPSSVVGFHSLRHSFVSFCANAGVPLAVVQALVGHGSPAMTRHYTHISSESAEKAINALPAFNAPEGRAEVPEKGADPQEQVRQVLELLDRTPDNPFAPEIRRILSAK